MRKLSQKKLQNSFLSTLVLFILTFSISAQSMFRKITDFDGDGKTDFAVTRSENNRKVWYVWQSLQGFKAFQWGLASDTPAAGDYDGDGKTDFAVYREPTSFPPVYTFYILQSQTNTFISKAFTTISNLGSAPMQQDYNGDGRTDPGFWHGEFGLTTTMTVSFSGTNSGFITSIPSRQVPLRIGDMDGDGRADKAHYTFSSNVVTITSLETNASRTVQFGASNDWHLAADFDGDNIGDLTVWRDSEGNWYWLRSSDGTFRAEHWGLDGDFPVPGDYDGDGKTDLAVYRPGTPNSFYYVNGSQSGFQAFAWGISTDLPILY